MDEMQDKLSLENSTGAGISRENSLSSLPETECDWPQLDTTVHEAHMAGSAGPPAPPHPPAMDMVGHMVPACEFSQHQQLTPQALYFQVAFLGGIEVRASPNLEAPRTGLVLMQHEVFAVSHHLPSPDGRVYLHLADGQGWVFDDSALVPHDPSVVQLPYVGHFPEQANMQASPMPPPWVAPVLAPAQELILPPTLPAPGADPITNIPPPPPLHAAPHEEQLALLSSAPVAVAPMPLPPVSWFRVSYLGGINLRAGPSIDYPFTGHTLAQMETFPAAEEVQGTDGRIYLLLCDGRGWAFDDSALMPLDPSVKRGNWMQPPPTNHIVGTRVLQEVQADAIPVRRRMHPQPRGKRGGKRCTRRAQNAAANSASAGAGVEG